MDPITVAELSMLLVVAFLLFRTQSGPPAHRGWRGFRRDPSIFPVPSGARSQRRQSEWFRERSRNIPGWVVGAVILLVGALSWWLNH